MQRQWLEAPGSVTPDAKDPLQRVLARRGGEHERAYLEGLRRSGRTVVALGREAGPAQTLAALASGAGVVYQAALEGGGFAGYADFLVLREDAGGAPCYGVWDTKLARLRCHFRMITPDTGLVAGVARE